MLTFPVVAMVASFECIMKDFRSTRIGTANIL